MHRNLVASTFLFLSLLAGCGSAEWVRKDARGGQLALSGAYMEATREAMALMAEHCGGRFAVYGAPRSGTLPERKQAPDRTDPEFDFVCTDSIDGTQQAMRGR